MSNEAGKGHKPKYLKISLAAALLVSLGVTYKFIKGNFSVHEDTNLHKNELVTNVEDSALDGYFKDVSVDAPIYTLARDFAQKGYINVYRYGELRPNQEITQSEFVELMRKVSNKSLDDLEAIGISGFLASSDEVKNMTASVIIASLLFGSKVEDGDKALEFMIKNNLSGSQPDSESILNRQDSLLLGGSLKDLINGGKQLDFSMLKPVVAEHPAEESLPDSTANIANTSKNTENTSSNPQQNTPQKPMRQRNSGQSIWHIVTTTPSEPAASGEGSSDRTNTGAVGNTGSSNTGTP